MTLSLYNSLTRTKAPFVPADPRRVTLYVCGPTVYASAHIGNARPAVVFDLLFRLLRHDYGPNHVLYARNITDVDDKIAAAALREGVDIATITNRYEARYLADMTALGVLPPSLSPHATAHIADMIALIETLLAKGAAYEAAGHVLFHVPGYAAYGALSGRNQDEILAGARVDVAPYKRDASDFVLWKPSTPDQPGWPSPWGCGRPGWHIECSAMIAHTLGQTIDIHAGGQDLIFPHHENELAQSCAAHGAPLARVWLHNGFLSLDKEKMSKSLGNILLVSDILASGAPGAAVRLALLSGHYRQPLNWTDGLVEQSKRTLDRWYGLLRGSVDLAPADPDPGVLAALHDDLNTPKALAEMARLAGEAAKNSALLPILNASIALLGLREDALEAWFQPASTAYALSPDAIAAQLAARTACRAAKDFAGADAIRQSLAAQGVVVEDGPNGSTWHYG